VVLFDSLLVRSFLQLSVGFPADSAASG
jgi:hypothetical protein